MLEAACPLMKTMFSIDFKLLKAAIWCHSHEKHTQSDSLKQEYRITFSHRGSRRRLRGPCHWGSFHWGWNGQRWRGVRYVWLRWLRINVVFAKRMPMKLNIHYLHSWATSRLMSPSSENGALRDETTPQQAISTYRWDFHHLVQQLDASVEFLPSLYRFYRSMFFPIVASHQHTWKSPSQGDLYPLQLNVRPRSPATLPPSTYL